MDGSTKQTLTGTSFKHDHSLNITKCYFMMYDEIVLLNLTKYFKESFPKPNQLVFVPKPVQIFTIVVSHKKTFIFQQ